MKFSTAIHQVDPWKVLGRQMSHNQLNRHFNLSFYLHQVYQENISLYCHTDHNTRNTNKKLKD